MSGLLHRWGRPGARASPSGRAPLAGPVGRAPWTGRAPGRLPRAPLVAGAITGLGGLALGVALHNGPMAAALGALGAFLPAQWSAWRRQRRRRRLLERMVPCLQQVAALTAVHGHPLPALQEVATHLDGPLGAGLRAALQEYHAGTPLPIALQRLAEREDANFYLHQLAALVELHLHHGTDLTAALTHLSQRLYLNAELVAEQQAEIGLYRAVSWGFFIASVAPVLWWWLTGQAVLDLLTQTEMGRFALSWVVVSGLAVAWAPTWWGVRAP
jgi:Flp pilus assembly protein TadB